jgi:aminoglycoside phosphotransferase family enzyme
MREAILGVYAERSGDAPPDALVHFYQSHRAMMRAKIAIWHLEEPALADPAKWTSQARDYLRIAGLHAGHCG